MRVHFIGIGGIGVSALVRYYLEKGHQVSGSDLVSSEITDALKKLGAKILIGHNQKCLTPGVKQVTYSPAVPADNPELKEAKKLGIKCQSYPEALGELTKKYFTIAVSGTHGKSTTTAMIGLILMKAGLNPTVIIGTKLREFGNSNFMMGDRPRTNVARTLLQGRNVLVIEADEHMASFLNYWPKIIILTNIEKDHLDYYKNLRNILKTYKKYIEHLPEGGWLAANRDDKNIKKITEKYTGLTCVYSIKQGEAEAKKLRKILKIPGEHNVSNALAALTVARAMGISDAISYKALSEYKGSWRRFETTEIRYPIRYTLVSDYAHHPTEIRVTLEAAREKYPKKEIWCVFQPHQYQRTYYLFNDFVKVFCQAPINKLIITDIYDVAGREEKKIKKKTNSEKLIKAIRKPWAIYLPKDKIINYLEKNLAGGEVIIVMGAGDIYNLVFDLTKIGKKKKMK